MQRREILPVLALAALCAAMFLMPSAEKIVSDVTDTARAEILSVDNSTVESVGLSEYGTQQVRARILSGPFKGKEVRAENMLRAQLETDKKFSAGDIALVTIPPQGVKDGDVLVARDHWRMGWCAILVITFSLCLVVFGGWTGAKALFSFVFSCVAVWKLLIPLCLAGWNGAWISLAIVAILSAVIIWLVAGSTRKALSAFLGAMLGICSSLFLAHVFSYFMHVNGATMPFAQSLINSGCENLDLYNLFCGSVILCSSGAVMDLAMDISAGVEEVAHHSSCLSRRELFLSGLRIGRAVVGTMTTTLLLAYSGGYLTLLMVFAIQGTAPLIFLNSTLLSAEIVKTLVGSFGMLLVAPFTALAAAWLNGHE